MSHLLFGFDNATAVEGWTAIDDRVMGGVSRSRLRHDVAGHAVFEGQVSLEQNGGFASVRSRAGMLGMSGAMACLIEARGDAKQYKLSLFADDAIDALSYQATFMPVADRWSTVRLPIDRFTPNFRGRQLAGQPALDPARIRQVGLMIAGRQSGEFALALRSMILV